MLDKKLVHIQGWMEENGLRFHHNVHEISIYLQAYELFISRIFPFNILRLGLTVSI